VGGTAKVRVDLRVISSTTRDLTAEIAAGRFREELYHRLNVVPIEVPPLEDRREDIPSLARISSRCSTRTGPALRELGEDAVAMLQTMPGPAMCANCRT
jgi:two-component system nitrogen regulation response regulator NtrX